MSNAQNTTAAVETAARGGRKAIVSDRNLVMAALVSIRDNAEKQPSAPVIKQLVEAGYVIKEFTKVEGKAGRPGVTYLVAPKFRSMLPLWEKNNANRAIKAARETVSANQVTVEMAQAFLEDAKAALAQAEMDVQTAKDTLKASEETLEAMINPPVAEPETEEVSETVTEEVTE